MTQPPIVIPGREDPVAASSVGWMGGPLGRWARVGATWWSPLRVVVVVSALAYALGYVLDLSCRSEGWRIPDRYEHLCYTDIAPLYTLRGFADGLLPYLQATPDGQHLEYPVLTGGFMQLAALIASGLTSLAPTGSPATVFFDVNVGLLYAAFLVTVVATALTVRRRPWDALMVALAPTMILAATVNWDLLTLAFTGLALLAWARRHPFTAGILLGLAVAAKFYPVLLLGGFAVLALRTGRWRATGLLVAGGALSWVAVNLPIAVANFEGWSYFYRFSAERGEDLGFGSIWFGLSQLGFPSVPDQLNAVATILFVALCGGIAYLGLAAPRRPRLVSLLFLIVVAFVLTNKVYSPQFSLWLVPLAAMARPRWRDFLIWQAGEVVYFAAIWWYLVGYTDGATGLDPEAYGIAVLVHVAATAYLAVMVIRDILNPEFDPVRTDGFEEDRDDPGGGVFDHAPDRITLPRRTEWS